MDNNSEPMTGYRVVEWKLTILPQSCCGVCRRMISHFGPPSEKTSIWSKEAGFVSCGGWYNHIQRRIRVVWKTYKQPTCNTKNDAHQHSKQANTSTNDTQPQSKCNVTFVPPLSSITLITPQPGLSAGSQPHPIIPTQATLPIVPGHSSPKPAVKVVKRAVKRM